MNFDSFRFAKRLTLTPVKRNCVVAERPWLTAMVKAGRSITHPHVSMAGLDLLSYGISNMASYTMLKTTL